MSDGCSKRCARYLPCACVAQASRGDERLHGAGLRVELHAELRDGALQPRDLAGGQASLIGKAGAGKVTINGQVKEVDNSDGGFFPSVSKDAKLSAVPDIASIRNQLYNQGQPQPTQPLPQVGGAGAGAAA